jgi:AcrR family transcriptional regulator
VDPRGATGNAGDERILRATIDALAQMDPASLTIQRICQEASVTPPTLYYHFGSKEGLIAAAVERLVSDWLSLLDRQVSREGDLEQMLAQAVAGWEAMIMTPSRPLAVFVWVTLLTANSSVPARDALIRARDRSHDMVVEALLPHVPDAGAAAGMAWSLIDGVIAAALEYQLDEDAAAMRRRLESMATMVQIVAGAAVAR